MKNALWLAVYAGFPKMVELLVGYGADLNTTDQDGVTALHMLLAGGPDLNMRPVSDDMNQLKKVQLGEAYFKVESYLKYGESYLNRLTAEFFPVEVTLSLWIP